jgi:hypothetical protein
MFKVDDVVIVVPLGKLRRIREIRDEQALCEELTAARRKAQDWFPIADLKTNDPRPMRVLP